MDTTNTNWQARLRANIAQVRQDIAAACERVGRAPASVRLVAVTKYVSPQVLREVVASGIADLGESRAQQLATRARDYGPSQLDWPGEHDAQAAPALPRWHMIGHVQRNKVKMLLTHTRIIHSLDSPRLAAELSKEAEALAAPVDVLIEVNVAGEASKSGLPPEAVAPLLAVCAPLSAVRVRGLMTMAPYDPDPEAARPHFARLRELLEHLRTTAGADLLGPHLSMGMSQDYTVAIEEGATFVRVGSALFTGLPSPRAPTA